MACLYLHIPFCQSKCHYCSFNSCAGGRQLHGPYVEALKKEVSFLEKTGSHGGLDTLFLGGGTPTCLSASELSSLVRYCVDLFGVVNGGEDTEVSVEANPGTVDSRYLETLLQVGVNRISFGVQSFDDLELQCLGRIHNEQDARAAVDAAREAGFTNVNLDLMYGLPGQTPASWYYSLEQGLSLFPEHLSLYQLTVEPDTPFHSLVAQNSLVLPLEDEILEMDEITKNLSGSAGFHQYETSNYALLGYNCRHNINYWLNNDYYGAGASAVSYMGGVRERRVVDPGEYMRLIEKNGSAVIESECLDLEASFRETVIMGLRMIHGVSRETLSGRYGFDPAEYYGSTLQVFIELKMVELTDSHLRITEKGWPLSNQILSELV